MLWAGVAAQLSLSAMLLYWLADQSEASPKMVQFYLVDWLNISLVSESVSDPGKHQNKFGTTCQ